MIQSDARLSDLPKGFRRDISLIKKRILNKFKDSAGILLVGSLAEKRFDRSSDIDIIWISKQALPLVPIAQIKFKTPKELLKKLTPIYKKLRRLGSFPPHEFILDPTDDYIYMTILSLAQMFEVIKGIKKNVDIGCFDENQFKDIFVNFPTLAHAIRSGIVLYEKNGFFRKYFTKRPHRPGRKYLEKYFNYWLRTYIDEMNQGGEGIKIDNRKFVLPFVFPSTIARVAKSLTLILMEVMGKGDLARNKYSLVKEIQKIGANQSIVSGMMFSLAAIRERRQLVATERKAVIKTVDWLRLKVSEQIKAKKL